MIFLKNWKILTYLGGAFLLLAFLWYIDHRGYARGYDTAEKKYEKALAEARQKTDARLAKMEKGYDSASKEIRKIPSGGCVGPANSSATDWMRENYSGSN